MTSPCHECFNEIYIYTNMLSITSMKWPKRLKVQCTWLSESCYKEKFEPTSRDSAVFCFFASVTYIRSSQLKPLNVPQLTNRESDLEEGGGSCSETLRFVATRWRRVNLRGEDGERSTKLAKNRRLCEAVTFRDHPWRSLQMQCQVNVCF